MQNADIIFVSLLNVFAANYLPTRSLTDLFSREDKSRGRARKKHRRKQNKDNRPGNDVAVTPTARVRREVVAAFKIYKMLIITCEIPTEFSYLIRYSIVKRTLINRIFDTDGEFSDAFSRMSMDIRILVRYFAVYKTVRHQLASFLLRVCNEIFAKSTRVKLVNYR